MAVPVFIKQKILFEDTYKSFILFLRKELLL
jgi:hypothetical protein